MGKPTGSPDEGLNSDYFEFFLYKAAPGKLRMKLLSDQQAVQRHLNTGNLLKKNEKLLEEKDAQIQELLAKVANIEVVSQENVRLREKLQEFGDIEAKKQELELQEFSLDIKQLEETETGKKK
ncbi:unnamed protein product [Caenorhabditis brenneri]